MKKMMLAVVLSLASSTALAHSHATEETYVEAGYVNFENQADGGFLGGLYRFEDSRFYLVGQARYVEVDQTSFGVTLAELGAGYSYPFADRYALFGEATYLHTDFDGVDEEGYRVSVGVSYAFTDHFVASTMLERTDRDESGIDVSGAVEGRYAITPAWSITGQVRFDDGIFGDTYQVGARYSF